VREGNHPMQRYRHDPSKNLVGFVVGQVEYAVAIARVKEIANPLAIVALPHAPRSVVGVADYRGEVVSVVDLRARFGLPSMPTTRKTKWIIVDVSPPGEGIEGATVRTGAAHTPEADAGVSGQLVALVVDAVTDVFGTGGAELRPAPELGGGDDARGIAGVTTHADGLVFVLDTARLRDLADPRGDASAGTSRSDKDSGERSSPAPARSLPARTAT
jgi:purine-binding chemotaxis protein CheW